MNNLSEILDIAPAWVEPLTTTSIIVGILAGIAMIIAAFRDKMILLAVSTIVLFLVGITAIVGSVKADGESEKLRVDKLQQVVEDEYGIVMEGEDLYRIANEKTGLRKKKETGVVDLPAQRDGEWIIVGVATLGDSMLLAEKDNDTYKVLNKD